MPRSLRWLLLLTLVVAGIWYYRAPRTAYDRFRTALVSGSEAGLEATVDFPALRDNLKQDLRPAIERAGGEVGALVGGLLVDQAVNNLLTPTGLAQVVTGFGMRRQITATTSPEHSTAITSFRYRSPSTVDVRIRAADAPEGATGVLTFQRQGLRWRLVRITSDRLLGAGSSE